MKSLTCPNGHCSPRKMPVPERSFATVSTGLVGEASSLPVPDLWKDLLLDHQDTLLSTPTSARTL